VIYLARHGRTAYNHEARFQGQRDIPLDETGLSQARDLARRAAGRGFAALWASPLRRARQTAQAVAAATGLEIRWDERLMETDAGDWTGRFFAEIQTEAPEALQSFLHGDPDFAFPGGESFAEQGDRVMAAIADVERGPQPALVVCHAVSIRLALSLRRGLLGPGAAEIANGALLPLDGDDVAAAVEEPPDATATHPG
jgi:broad specificity phosphatase PhoE